MRRRDLLSLAGGAALLPLGGGAFAAAASGGPKRLVVVLLRGAADGLNVVIPYADAAYYEGRPSIAIQKPGSGDGAGLDLDGHFALHPALAPLLPLWREKQLAFIHAAGSPDPSRSHFDAQLFMESGTPGQRNASGGWMNRLLAAMPEARSPTSAVAIGPVVPQILRGAIPVANLPLGPAAANPIAIDRPEVAAAFDRLYAGNDSIGQAYQQGRAARTALVANMSAEQSMADNGAPSPNSLPALAARLAGLVSRDKDMRLVFLNFGGWDTHVRQGAEKGQLADRLRPLGEGLAAFARALGSGWQDTVVVVMSEFGRTVRENGDGGTDHGHANVMWVLGGPVRGGKVYGDWPGITKAALYEGRDLAVTTDFRTVLAGLVERHLGLGDHALAQIFPSFAPPQSETARLVA